MNFAPKNQDQINKERLWPKGEYAFEVIEAIDRPSQAGNQMIELRLRLTKADGLTRLITDYLVEKRLEKVLHAATACGLADKYKKGTLPAVDFVGKRGRLKLGIEKGKASFPDKNVVLDYVAPGLSKGQAGGVLSFK